LSQALTAAVESLPWPSMTVRTLNRSCFGAHQFHRSSGTGMLSPGRPQQAHELIHALLVSFEQAAEVEAEGGGNRGDGLCGPLNHQAFKAVARERHAGPDDAVVGSLHDSVGTHYEAAEVGSARGIKIGDVFQELSAEIALQR